MRGYPAADDEKRRTMPAQGSGITGVRFFISDVPLYTKETTSGFRNHRGAFRIGDVPLYTGWNAWWTCRFQSVINALFSHYRGTSLISKTQAPRITTGPKA